MSLEELAKTVDYAALKQQKETLIELVGKVSWMYQDDLDAIINFIDAFQDTVVDSNVLPENEVFL
jgi:hypothetical protein